MRIAGTFHVRGGGRIGVHLDLGSGLVARRAFSLARSYGLPAELRAYRQPAFGRSRRFELHLGDDGRTLQTLNEAGILDATLAPRDRPPARLVARSCCRAAYLRGAFLAGGSVIGHPDAHLELRTATVETAAQLAEVAQVEGFRAGVARRRGHALAYLKGQEAIADLLAFLGADGAALKLGEQAVIVATRGKANRLANADHANLVRVTQAADPQLRAIARLEQLGRLQELTPELAELARLRARNPSLSLAELGRRCRPQLGKATVHRRLERIKRLAQE